MIAYAWSVFDGRLVVGPRPIPAMGVVLDVDRLVEQLGRGETVLVVNQAKLIEAVRARLAAHGVDVSAVDAQILF